MWVVLVMVLLWFSCIFLFDSIIVCLFIWCMFRLKLMCVWVEGFLKISVIMWFFSGNLLFSVFLGCLVWVFFMWWVLLIMLCKVVLLVVWMLRKLFIFYVFWIDWVRKLVCLWKVKVWFGILWGICVFCCYWWCVMMCIMVLFLVGCSVLFVKFVLV